MELGGVLCPADRPGALINGTGWCIVPSQNQGYDLRNIIYLLKHLGSNKMGYVIFTTLQFKTTPADIVFKPLRAEIISGNMEICFHFTTISQHS